MIYFPFHFCVPRREFPISPKNAPLDSYGNQLVLHIKLPASTAITGAGLARHRRSRRAKNGAPFHLSSDTLHWRRRGGLAAAIRGEQKLQQPITAVENLCKNVYMNSFTSFKDGLCTTLKASGSSELFRASASIYRRESRGPTSKTRHWVSGNAVVYRIFVKQTRLPWN